MEIHAIKTYCTNKECWEVELVYEDKLINIQRKQKAPHKVKTKKILEYYFDKDNWRPPSVANTAQKLNVSKSLIYKVLHKYGKS